MSPPPQRLTESEVQEITGLCELLAAAPRLRVLDVLSVVGPLDVGTLCRHAGMNLPSVSNHLAFMRLRGLVEPRRAGKRNIYSPTPLGEAVYLMFRSLTEARS